MAKDEETVKTRPEVEDDKPAVLIDLFGEMILEEDYIKWARSFDDMIRRD